MNIDNICSYNQKNQNFGHRFSEPMFRTTGKGLPYYAAKIKQEKSNVEYDKYMGALKTFSQTGFDATGIVKEYWEKTKPFGNDIAQKFRNVLGDMNFPRTEKKKGLPWDGLDITKLEAEVSQPDTLLYDGNELFCDYGIRGNRVKISENADQLIKDDKGIENLTATVNKGIEQTLREKLDATMKEAEERKFKAAMDEEISIMEKMGIKPVFPSFEYSEGFPK